jgi:hypothetical protein
MSNDSELDGVVPILQGLIKRIRAKPTVSDLEYMRKTDVKELRHFFDALSSGQTDQDTYDALLDYIRGRHDPKYVTIAQRKAKEEADRKAKEEAERKAMEDALRLEMERKSKAEAERKAKDEADRKAKLDAENRSRLEAERKAKDEAARRAKEEHERKATEAAERAAREDAVKRALLSKAQTRAIGKDLDISIAEASGKFTVFITNNGVNSISLFLDFSGSENMAIDAIFGPTKQPGPMQVELSVPKGEKELQIARLAVVNSDKSYGFSYKAKMLEEHPAEDEDQITKVADGLSVVVRSVETGYKVLITNSHQSHKFLLRVNFSESKNLKITPAANHKLEDASTVVGHITNGFEQEFAFASVDNYEEGCCDIRYRISARIE